MYGDRIKESTTTTGTGSVTLGGAAAQSAAFTSAVPNGDPTEYAIFDANGTGWETGDGTVTGSNTLSRDTVFESSTGSALALSSGTHTVMQALTADAMNKRQVFGDAGLDYAVSGLVVPTISGSLAGTITAGVAYVVGARVRKGAQSKTYTASKDTYVDLSNKGILTYVEVANSASAPAFTANSMRLGKVVTSGAAITGGTDLRNLIYAPTCALLGTSMGVATPDLTGTVVPFSSAAFEKVNNNGMHSTSTNPSRVTIATAGLYLASGYVESSASSSSTVTFYASIQKNGSIALAKGSEPNVPSGGAAQVSISGALTYCVVGDYLELLSYPADNGGTTGQTVTTAALNVVRVG